MSIDFFTRLPLHGETRFLPGDPHLEENYRLGEHIRPHFRHLRQPAARHPERPSEQVA